RSEVQILSPRQLKLAGILPSSSAADRRCVGDRGVGTKWVTNGAARRSGARGSAGSGGSEAPPAASWLCCSPFHGSVVATENRAWRKDPSDAVARAGSRPRNPISSTTFLVFMATLGLSAQ